MPGAENVAKCLEAPPQQANSTISASTWRLWVVASIAALCGCLFGMDLGKRRAPNCRIQECIAQDGPLLPVLRVLYTRLLTQLLWQALLVA